VEECKPLAGGAAPRRGREVQVDPIKPTLKPPGSKRLKLEDEKALSNFAFKFNLRRYTVFQSAPFISRDQRAAQLHAALQAGPHTRSLLSST